MASRGLATAVGIVVVASAFRAASGEIIELWSGNGDVGDLEPAITFISGPERRPLRDQLFSSIDYRSARLGAHAYIVGQVHGNWVQSLPSDPEADWISSSAQAFAHSALFAVPFLIAEPLITGARIDLWWAADDALGYVDDNGDPNGPNPIGAYLNGLPLSADFSAVGFRTEHHASMDVTQLVASGQNWLYLYNRDIGGSGSAIMFSARITVVPGVATIGPVMAASLWLSCLRRRRVGP